MTTLRETWRRLVAVVRRDDLDDDFDDEVRSHIAMATDDYIAEGLWPDDARRLARLRFGSLAASRDLHRDARGLPWLEGWWFDLRLAVRALRRDWAVTLAAAAMLTLAIALNATVYTVMDAMLFRGLPMAAESDRLVYVQERYPSGMNAGFYADFENWRAEAASFEALAYVGSRSVALRDADDRPLDMRVRTVSANTLSLLGVPPVLGRDFTTADEGPGAPPVVLLNHRFWQSRFAGRADAVGATISIDGARATIVGVMPAGFDFPLPAGGEMWMPVTRTPDLLRRGPTAGSFIVVGRLAKGVSIETARTELETINQRLATAYPKTNRGLRPRVFDHAEFNSGADAFMIWGSLWVAACFLLLIACANVANLTLARTVGRWRELATKLALGAGRTRMIRQLALEGLMIGVAAGATAWLLTTWSVAGWATMAASQYQTIDYSVGAGTPLYLAAISLVSAALFSAAPIARVLQLGVGDALKGDARGVTAGLRGKRLSAALVGGQMALAIILLAGAGVLVRSFANIVGAETGVRDPAHVLTGLLRLPSERYPTPGARLDYFGRVRTRLREVPGIEHESVSGGLPVKFPGGVRPFVIEGRPAPPDRDKVVGVDTAGTDYFDALGATITAGRAFADHDGSPGTPVAIVNQRFAELNWPGESPLGKRLRLTGRDTSGDWRVVVGVVSNVMEGDALRQDFKPIVYTPFGQEPAPQAAFFLLRTGVPPEQVAGAVRAAIHDLDPDVALERFNTLEDTFAFDRDYMDMDHSELGKHATVAPVFAVMAVLLAAIGLVAVIAHSVTQRTKEIGVRMAIGASARDIARMILREGMAPVLMGLVVGLAVAAGVNRVLQSQLVGVSPDDPLALGGAAVLLIAIALLACRIPARRAMRVDPVVALRHE